jgi:energy-coupling factor transporter ATP-binding protein EcfA2
MSHLDYETIRKAFTPSREILNPELFVGRKDEIITAIESLQTDGSFIAIYGVRGVGKSSFAQQLKLIAEGDKILINTLKLEYINPNSTFDFITHYIQCDFTINNTRDLIKRILFGDNENPSLFDLSDSGNRILETVKKTFKGEGGGGLLGLKLIASGQEESSFSTYTTDDLVQVFKIVLGNIKKDNPHRDGLLIVIDEYDVVNDKSGFSSLIKTCSNDFVKFVTVGIAHSINELMSDHASINRQLQTIEIQSMYPEEMEGIITRAEYIIDHEIRFDQYARKTITSQAHGFPYFVHLLGSEALSNAFHVGQKNIDEEVIKRLIVKIKNGKLKTVYENHYHDIVGNSKDKEYLLKLLAETEDEEIYIIPILKEISELGIVLAPELLIELTLDVEQPVLVQIRNHYFRFFDPVFKVYARIRNWKF